MHSVCTVHHVHHGKLSMHTAQPPSRKGRSLCMSPTALSILPIQRHDDSLFPRPPRNTAPPGTRALLIAARARAILNTHMSTVATDHARDPGTRRQLKRWPLREELKPGVGYLAPAAIWPQEVT